MAIIFQLYIYGYMLVCIPSSSSSSSFIYCHARWRKNHSAVSYIYIKTVTATYTYKNTSPHLYKYTFKQKTLHIPNNHDKNIITEKFLCKFNQTSPESFFASSIRLRPIVYFLILSSIAYHILINSHLIGGAVLREGGGGGGASGAQAPQNLLKPPKILDDIGAC